MPGMQARSTELYRAPLERRFRAPRAIEMEDVHQLVSDHQLQPIVKVGEGETTKRRLCANDDPIRGKDMGNSTGKVRVIGKKQVDPT